MLFFDILVFLYYVYIFVAAVFLILDNRKTASTFAWLFVFLVIPVVGILFYILFGKNHRIIGRKRKKIERMIRKNFAESLNPLVPVHDKIKEEMNKEDVSLRKNKIINLLEKNSYSLLTANNKVQVLQKGEDKFSLLKKDLQSAEKFIHMAYFIWRDDDLTQKIKDTLIGRARAGIEVRILIDAVGSFFLSRKYKHELRNAGVQIYRYFDFSSLFTLHTINYRNHRKIVVVDGRIGYTGGMNMGKEYISGAFGYKYWRDTHVRIAGEGAKILQAVFVLEWENTTKEKIFGKKYFPEIGDNYGSSRMQLAVSGPDSQWDSVKQVYFEMICSAKKNIYIQSPYFVPDEGLMDALKAASLSGVDVKIMITGVPDKHIPYWAAFTYFEDLLDSGVRIFHYNKCFLHSKTIVTDSDICSVGTANFDIRSFVINYELMAVFYDKNLSLGLERDFNNDLSDCTEMTRKIYARLGTLIKFRNSVARLMSPLL